MAWVIITLEDLQRARAGALITAMRTAALALGQVDPMPKAILGVVNEVRGCIAFQGEAVLDIDPEKVPGNLHDIAVQRVIRVMKGRLMQAFTEDETKEETTYQARLKLLTEGKWPVDKTDDPQEVPSVQPETGEGFYGSADKLAL